ncbi:MAG: metal-dependent hydrolase [Acidobacteria bacterium]|nr:metal-dependent hydrolase [Acidobacteriota bacterium]
MPTPIGHALGGLAAGAAVAGRGNHRWFGSHPWLILSVWALCGVLPDVDFLVGGHRELTHTLGAVAGVGCVTAILARHRPLLWLAATAAYSTHLLLDWLGADDAAPLGIMALWPFADAYYLSPYSLFPAVCRHVSSVGCRVDLVEAVAWEVLILGPTAALAVWLRHRQRTDPRVNPLRPD